MNRPCEVPACAEPAIDVMVFFGPPPQAVAMCAEHVDEFTTPVEPAPERGADL